MDKEKPPKFIPSKTTAPSVAKKMAEDKAKFLEILEKNKGNIAQTVRDMKKDRKTYYRWTDKDPEFKYNCEDIREKYEDYVKEDRHNATQNRVAKNNFLKVYASCIGNVTRTCQLINMSKSTYYKWYNTDEEFRKEVDEVENLAFDLVEEKMFEAIERGSVKMIETFLKYKGKKRGYTPHQTIENKGDSKIIIEAGDKLDEE